MTLHHLREAPPQALANALAEFEKQFTYPLGPGRTFRISHGDDYTRFFGAMGEPSCFVMEKDGRVQGVLCVSERRMLLPDGGEKTVAYISDLKVDPTPGNAFVFPKLARSALRAMGARLSAGFSVVMDGTRRTPDSYSGKLGIPAARALGKTIIWQFETGPTASSIQSHRSDRNCVLACHRKLSLGRYASIGAKPSERSEMTPVWLVHPSGSACGLVEDTRRCKRLFADDATELRSGHLSYFAFSSPAAGADLIRTAIDSSSRAGYPAMFVALAPSDVPVLEAALGGLQKVVAPATIYGINLDGSILWNINTAEI